MTNKKEIFADFVPMLIGICILWSCIIISALLGSIITGFLLPTGIMSILFGIAITSRNVGRNILEANK